LRRQEYGDERDPETRKFLLKISPLKNASKIRKPLFVAAGSNDPRVPLSESNQIVTQVRKHKVPVYYLIAQDEGHIFTKKTNINSLWAAEVWFLKTLLFSNNNLTEQSTTR
jgi:dipeptidyl aminopeptidase/acylaminoacyl peptidase